jgi:hypothetical protein
MRFDKATNRYVLASGRRIYAHDGVLGLKPGVDADSGRLAGGYDDMIEDQNGLLVEEDGDDARLTAAERQEIADIMIDGWRQWASQTSQK